MILGFFLGKKKCLWGAVTAAKIAMVFGLTREIRKIDASEGLMSKSSIRQEEAHRAKEFAYFSNSPDTKRSTHCALDSASPVVPAMFLQMMMTVLY